MIKKYCFMLISVMLLILGGCADPANMSSGKIIPPSIHAGPLQGKWMVVRDLDPGNNDLNVNQPRVVNNIQFGREFIAFDKNVWGSLAYKIKRAKAVSYLNIKYISAADIPVSANQAVDIITIYADSNFLGEFMRIDDETMIFFTQNQSFLLAKTSDDIDIPFATVGNDALATSQYKSQGASGVLLGLRIPSNEGYRYQTLWIANAKEQLNPLLSIDKLFFPRTSGFWELESEDIWFAGQRGNALKASSVATRSPERKGIATDIEQPADTDPATSIINYIGNDYVAIEKDTNGLMRLQVLPVDAIASATELRFADILGQKSLKVYLNAREEVVAELKKAGGILIATEDLQKSFGLVRHNGHWILIGRVNFQKDGELGEVDFDLQVVPPANLISYDRLALSWHSIKNRVPDALDGFTSPNGDIALVRTKGKLNIYAIFAEQLAKKPLAEIDLPEETTIIMIEWATGSYVDSWEKSFSNYGAKPLPASSWRKYQR